MREVLSELTAIRDAGGTAAMATVVRTWRSAPRPAGASMLVTDAGEAVGSVSGGCVEGALYELGQEVLADGGSPLRDLRRQRRRRLRGRPDLRRHPRGVRRARRRRRPGPSWPGVAAASRPRSRSPSPPSCAGPHFVGRHLVVRPDHTEGTLGTDAPRRHRRARTSSACSQSGTTGFLHYGPEGERLGEGLDVFVASYAPPPQMFIFGAIDFSAALVEGGQGPRLPRHRRRRPAGLRHPQAVPRRRRGRRRLAAPLAEPAAGRPTHGHRRAHPRPEVRRARARASPCAPMRRTSARWGRGARTRTDSSASRRPGSPTTSSRRLHSPIGLDLGARTPEETAISIAAEIVQARWGGSGGHLASTDGPIHPGAHGDR